MAEPYTLELKQGATYTRVIRWLVGGVAQPLGTYTIHSQVRESEKQSARLILDLAQFMTLNGEGDAITFRIPGDVTHGLNPDKFKRAAWDLFLVANGDPTERELLLQGPVTCDPAATVVD